VNADDLLVETQQSGPDMLDPDLLTSYNAVRATPNKEVFCHAPFVNMNFAQNGNVTVCCYNRTYVLGTYPGETLEEIWHGTQARQLRDSMSRNELPQGCDICLSQFWSSNFAGLRARSFDHLAERKYREDGDRLLVFPKLMEFEISNVCNLECTMCDGTFSSSIRHNREKLPPLKSPYDESFVRQLEPFIPHLREARFLGGEPFLIRTYYQIWDLIIRLNPGMNVTITTNATILNDRVKSVLEKLRANIVVSIDSLSRETYEQIRVNASYDDVMRNLDFFREYTKRNDRWLTLATCPMRQNWRELPSIVEYCNSYGIQVFFNTVVFPCEAAFLYMTHAELNEVLTHLEAVQLPDSTELQRRNKERYRDLVRQIAGYRDRKGAFRDSDSTRLPSDQWEIPLGQGCIANLERSTASAGPLRVIVSETDAGRTDPIRLTSRHLPIRSNQRYVLEFSGRAGDGHQITVGARRAHPPRKNLGLYLRFGLSPVWERFEFDFVPNGDDDSGQFYFDLTRAVADIELADITLRVVPLANGETSTDGPAIEVQEACGITSKPLTLFRQPPQQTTPSSPLLAKLLHRLRASVGGRS
jgi:MoaA/NifB/PqqE/SkfB family radical SAM enzyme